MPARKLIALAFLSASCALAAGGKLSAVIIDGVNNHDWVAGSAAIRTILEGSGRRNVRRVASRSSSKTATLPPARNAASSNPKADAD